MLIDLHADTPLLQHWIHYDFCASHKPWLPASAFVSHVDLPRMQEANMDAQVFGLVALPPEGDERGFVTVQRMIDQMEQTAQRTPGTFSLLRRGESLRAKRAGGERVGILSLEGVHTLAGKIERADQLIARGVLSFGLAHFHANQACNPAYGWGAKASGLTPFGRDLVAHLAAQGAIVDLAHINRAGFFDALQASQGPIMVSHTGVVGAFDHWRNIDDAQIRAIADRGGIVGIIFARNYLGGSDMDAVVKHIKHVVNVGGTACAALGSDFDGFIVPVKGLRDVRGYTALRAVLQNSGLSAQDTDHVMGQNAQNFLEKALYKPSTKTTATAD